MYVDYNYYVVDRLGYYYKNELNGFPDFTKNIDEAYIFRHEMMAESKCKKLGVSFRVVAIQK